MASCESGTVRNGREHMTFLGRMFCWSVCLPIVCRLASAQAPTARPISIKDAVRLALRQNPQRLIAGLVVSERKEDRTIARSALLPQADLLAAQGVQSYNLQSISGGRNPVRIGPFQTISAGPSVYANLLNLPLLRQYQASREDIRTTTFQETTVREQITAVIVTQYLLVLRATADRDAASARVELAQRLYGQAQQLQRTGVGTDIDTLRAQVELQNEKQRLIDATTQRNTAIYVLGQELALPRGQDPEPTDTMQFYGLPQFAREDLVGEALQKRPEVKALLSAERAAALRAKAAGEQRLPSLEFAGSYDFQGRKLDSGLGAYGYSVGLRIPLSTGGRIRAEHERAKLELERIQQNRRDLENSVEQQVKTALDQLNAARQSVDVAELGLTLARQEVERATRRFEAGVATNIEVITAQSDLARADDNRIEALYRFNQARADLARSVGNAEDIYGN
jgi:outer membrane protein